MHTCICDKALNKINGKIIPCANCIDVAVQKVLTSLHTISLIDKKQAEILRGRKLTLVKTMEAKPNVRKITVKP